ncbi:ABC transporter ATP-binding protein [Spiroplasma cantharicola]|uniref:Lipopolysaccharide export system ATP-binding protein n=1 Tax=Spiroplasma cantharicola TaxID=362837 RepID=A0A0M4KEN9_9MOLU|nr:ABC transporter ATP-binding protein [Spiroplasma cantharicola]ALD66495.1 lipopolysaccharide export system ATP-binding protein [Spiroplasma cantharicola]
MIKINNISKVYQNFELKDVNLEFKSSDIIALIGENGSGKTTLIKSIFNLVKLDSGNIEFDNENLHIWKNLTKISFFSDQNSIPLELTLKQYLWYLSKLNNMKKDIFIKKQEKILKMIEIEDLINKKLKNLSSGQKKKAILAGVLLTEPKFIFFDEPTANLDIDSKIEFLEIIKYLGELKIGMLITSHLAEELQLIANRVILIKKGKILYDEYFDNKKNSIQDIYQKYYTNKKMNIDLLREVYE